MSYPTSRRFPRSTSEAFAQDRAYCVEVYRPHRRWWRWALFACVVALALMACGGGGGEPEQVPDDRRPTEKNR